jgi:hypothetical protein
MTKLHKPALALASITVSDTPRQVQPSLKPFDAHRYSRIASVLDIASGLL